MTDNVPPKGFVFVVTYGRSGSTVVQSVLQSIDGYCIRGENNNILLPLFEAYEQSVRGGENVPAEPMATNHPWFGFDAVQPARFAAGLRDVFLREIIQAPQNARAIGFKEIRFHQAGEDKFEPYLDFIRETFAPAKFVFNMRDWHSVSQSGWWATMKPDVVRAKVEMCDRLYKSYAAKYPAQCFLMQYEDYANNPAAFAPLYDFLGEAFDLAAVKEVTGRHLPH